MGEQQPQEQQRLYPLISTLAYKMCRHRPDECADPKSKYSKVLAGLQRRLRGLLGDDCATTDSLRQTQILTALKAIGVYDGILGFVTKKQKIY